MTNGKTCCSPSRAENALSKGSDNSLGIPASLAPADHLDRSVSVCFIPGGTSFIGTDSPLFAVDEEAPFRAGKIKSFWIDKHTVTNHQFRMFVQETGYQTEAEKFGNSFVFYDFLEDKKDKGNAVAAAPWWRMVDGACWKHPLGPQSDISSLLAHPAVHISWHDAAAFADWAGGRLPTEAEWEHAARGGLGDVRYPWGDDAPDDKNHLPCNIWQGTFPEHNTAQDGYAATAPAVSFAPNGYGIFNMVGNVWEWTAQNFKIRSLKKSVRLAHPDKKGFKICKGGSYLCHESYCHRYRIAARTANSPDSSTGHTGFRLVYDKDPYETNAASQQP